jgi:LysR family transcriptional regulator, glycine cleavage system transcriptional activator
MKERELPLIALRAFAVAARTSNLTSAAEELGVTHGAISKQVNALERWLGQQVFAREGRGLVLTPYGQILASKLGQAMKDIGAACDYVRRQRSQTVLAVEAPATFAMYFLMPRLRLFEAKNSNFAVWISTRVTGQTADFSANDIVITRGSAERVTSHLHEPTHLFDEQLTVVSAPTLLKKRPVKKPSDVLKHRLIASETRPGHWNAWLSAAGIHDYVLDGGHRFDHLFVAMHAVREGLGSIVAPKNFFRANDPQASLRCPLPGITVKGEAYFAHSTSRADPEYANRFVSWLKAITESH